MSKSIYLISEEPEWHEDPSACALIRKFQKSGREYWLVRVEPPFVVPAYSPEEKNMAQGRFGERTNSEYVVIVPRHEGITFDRLTKEAVSVHVAVPKFDRYPPDKLSLSLDEYIHLFWGLVYPTYKDAKQNVFSFGNDNP